MKADEIGRLFTTLMNINKNFQLLIKNVLSVYMEVKPITKGSKEIAPILKKLPKVFKTLTRTPQKMLTSFPG